MVMGKKADAEVAALRVQVEALQAEVAALKAVPWWQQPGGGVAYGWPMPACTCGQTQGCWQHPRPWPGNVWCSTLHANACAGGGVSQVVTINPDAAPITYMCDLTSVAAGCAPVQTFTVPAGL
jgi:hypothetical protein